MRGKEKTEIRLELKTKEVWAKTQEILAKKLSQPSFETWIKPVHLVEIANNQATIAVVNEFSKNWILSKYVNNISCALEQVLGRKVVIKVVVDSQIQPDYLPSIASISVAPTVASSTIPQESRQSLQDAADSAARLALANLNAKYTFATFVVGSHNRFCHSAAMAVADRPGQTYNPLFVYGGVGLGKTHIMQAIGHHILLHAPKLTVRYITCERFTNELINSIRDDRMVEFRKRYRQVDVLLMDDIQFIQGKESTQEEFFHTFNSLRDSGRQIVLSSDRPPKAISLLEERLRSRFEWGLIADIQAPDLETRLAILRKKSALEAMQVSPEVLEYIAAVFTSNIRELEGALLRAHAYSHLTGCSLTIEDAKSVIAPGASQKPKPIITVQKILDTVASHYRLETSDLKSSKRSQDLTLPRHVAMYLAHELLSMSFPRIGQFFGDRKHTSALYAYDKIKEAISKDKDLSLVVKQIADQLSV